MMAVRIVRLGSPRARDEGPRLGTVRRPPRGVPKRDFARRDYYDVWLPELAPSAPMVSWALSTPWTPQRWRSYVRRYLAEMKQPAAQHLIATLAVLSQHTNFSVGCYCEDATHCHRSLLAELLAQNGANVANSSSTTVFDATRGPS
jgi:uncharacterized protein YeaO (DUF488 family)